MLTKDLLRFRIVNSAAKPQFINVSDPDLLTLAERLIECYRLEEGQVCSLLEIREEVENQIHSYPNEKIAQGLNKIILDRCDFSNPDEFDYPALRAEIFAASAAVLKKETSGLSPEKLADKVRNSLSTDAGKLFDAGMYSDLPGNETLIKSPSVFPRELLERYNCSLVQSLLLFSGSLELIIEDPEPAKMRRMFKYLKFFRLLAKITSVAGNRRFKEAPEKLKIIIDGPISLFENTRKYGLQLACFFPAILDMKKWKLKTIVNPKNRELKLNLDESSKLVGHYRNFSSYVPEEIAMFHRLFKTKVSDWKITGNAPLFQADNHELIFPDLSFTDESDRTIHLELFHRWHSVPLLERLEFCNRNPDLPLIIGIDRALYKKPEVKDRVDSSEYFQQAGFLFRDFPGVDNVRKILNARAKLN